MLAGGGQGVYNIHQLREVITEPDVEEDSSDDVCSSGEFHAQEDLSQCEVTMVPTQNIDALSLVLPAI